MFECTVYLFTSLYRVNHSKNAIVKPQGPTPQEERREIEEAMKRIKEANQAIAKAMDTDPPPPGEYSVYYEEVGQCPARLYQMLRTTI